MQPKVAERPTASKTKNSPIAVHNTAIEMNAARTLRPILADKDGELPTRIMIMKAGTWADSVKGNLIISTEDLKEMVENFNRGLGQAGEGIGLPIDFSHNDWAEAAGWIQGLVVEGDTLYADPVSWTSKGEEALRGGLYKCFSPAFYPSCLGEWHDPENWERTARNVLEGGALTNIPFFKDLSPIMASTSHNQGNEDKNTLYINASNEKENHMDLAEVRAKENDSLSEDERNFLTENKGQLTPEELAKFGFEAPKAEEEEQEEEQEQEEVETPEAQAVLAAIKSGEKVLVEASTIKSLQATAKKYETEKAEAEVQKHIARGAIKADQKDAWTKKVMADNSTLELLQNLPDNQVLASEIGASTKTADATSPTAQIENLANARVEAARKENRTLDFGTAVSQVMKENPELAKQYQSESAGKEQ